MLVYGDPSYELSVGELAHRLRERLAAVSAATASFGGAASLVEAARAALILAGMVEQAIVDAEPSGAAARASEEITDHLAAVFASAWSEPGEQGREGIELAARAAERKLGAINPSAAAAEHRVTVKIPEGFAFYALFPEQYVAAARQWMRAQDDARGSVLVVGLRSIGTSLSAAVAAELSRGGWQVRRATVRPDGPPFDRCVNIDPAMARGAEYGLVVDEGPGASGSSMLAAAAAIERAGIERGKLALFPGHAGEPGAAASQEMRAAWKRTPRFFVPLSQLRWQGRTLLERFRQRTAMLYDGARIERIEDLSAGAWRAVNYRSEADWPAVCAPFERAKYRVVLDDERAVLWKFAGLCPDRSGADMAEAERALLAQRGIHGWTPIPVDIHAGFVAIPWVQGRALRREDGSPAVLSLIGRYIRATARPRLSEEQTRAAVDRLGRMVCRNVQLGLGEDHAREAARCCDDAARFVRPSRAAGDGRLAPHEWVREPGGRLVKTDAAGHHADHTIIGEQPLAWDVAGAMVEWDLSRDSRSALAPMLGELDAPIPSAVLRFFCLAYAAFRMGQCALCADLLPGDGAERGRLVPAVEFYRERILRELSQGSGE